MTALSVDTASSTPAWEQLRDQLARYIAGGQLTPGTRLPAIRQLAGDLGLAPGTVARAYSELERIELIRTRRPQGSFVSDGRPSAPALLARLAETFAAQAQQLGAGPDDAVRALQTAYRTP
jgi:GntR family transcriptional regulator